MKDFFQRKKIAAEALCMELISDVTSTFCKLQSGCNVQVFDGMGVVSFSSFSAPNIIYKGMVSRGTYEI